MDQITEITKIRIMARKLHLHANTGNYESFSMVIVELQTINKLNSSPLISQLPFLRFKSIKISPFKQECEATIFISRPIILKESKTNIWTLHFD